MRWHENKHNVQALAEALVDEGFIYNCYDLLQFYAHPRLWDAEWQWVEQHGTMAGFEGSLESRRRA